MSSSYPLFRLRWALIVVQILTASCSLTAAVIYAYGTSIGVWSVLGAFSIVSILLCIWDLSIHKKLEPAPDRPAMSGDGYAQVQAQQSPGQGSPSTSQRNTPAAAANDNHQDVISVADDDERLPFITPHGESDSEKSDDDGKSGKSTFHPNKLVTLLDAALMIALTTLYFVALAGASSRSVVVRVFAITGTVIAIYLHLHCLWKEVKALKKEKRKNALQRLRRGVLRL